MLSSLSWGKRGLVLLTQATEWLNQTYDPFDVDMKEWSIHQTE